MPSRFKSTPRDPKTGKPLGYYDKSGKFHATKTGVSNVTPGPAEARFSGLPGNTGFGLTGAARPNSTIGTRRTVGPTEQVYAGSGGWKNIPSDWNNRGQPINRAGQRVFPAPTGSVGQIPPGPAEARFSGLPGNTGFGLTGAARPAGTTPPDPRTVAENRRIDQATRTFISDSTRSTGNNPGQYFYTDGSGVPQGRLGTMGPGDTGFPKGMTGEEYQQRLEGFVPAQPPLRKTPPTGGRPASPPQSQSSAGRPTPPPVQQSSAPTTRVVPGPDGKMVPVPANNAFTPGFGSSAGVGFSRENLARSLAGEDWTNKGVVQQAGQVAGEIAFNEKVNNPFVNAQFGQLATTPSFLSPNQPQAPGIRGFNTGGLLAGAAQTTDMISVPNALTGITNASFNPGAVDVTAAVTDLAPPAESSEKAAQAMVSNALQEQIKLNRGMPVLGR